MKKMKKQNGSVYANFMAVLFLFIATLGVLFVLGFLKPLYNVNASSHSQSAKNHEMLGLVIHEPATLEKLRDAADEHGFYERPRIEDSNVSGEPTLSYYWDWSKTDGIDGMESAISFDVIQNTKTNGKMILVGITQEYRFTDPQHCYITFDLTLDAIQSIYGSTAEELLSVDPSSEPSLDHSLYPYRGDIQTPDMGCVEKYGTYSFFVRLISNSNQLALISTEYHPPNFEQ